jgi:RNA polymerase sigma-70 factor (ECF subfamily)
MVETYSMEDFLDDLAQAMPALYSLAFRMADNAEDARDLIQDTSMTAWEKRSQLRSREAFVPWTRRILMNRFVRAARKVGAQRPLEWQDSECEFEVPSNMPSPEEEALVAETIREVRDACFTAMVRHLTIPQRASVS